MSWRYPAKWYKSWDNSRVKQQRHYIHQKMAPKVKISILNFSLWLIHSFIQWSWIWESSLTVTNLKLKQNQKKKKNLMMNLRKLELKNSFWIHHRKIWIFWILVTRMMIIWSFISLVFRIKPILWIVRVYSLNK